MLDATKGNSVLFDFAVQEIKSNKAVNIMLIRIKLIVIRIAAFCSFFIFYISLPQRIQTFYQSLERAIGSFDWCGVGEADPISAEGREDRARNNRNAMIFSKILSKWFGICPAFGFNKFTDVHECIITFADDVLESAFGE